jgi:hypothetical protein
LADVLIQLEFVEKPSTPPFEPWALSSRIYIERTREHGHQSDDILECELVNRISIIISRRGLDSENAWPELDNVQVKLKNPIFG